MTDREQAVLDVVADHWASKGYAPSVREIGAAIGVNSTSTVHGIIKGLERKGLLVQDNADGTRIRTLRLAGV